MIWMLLLVLGTYGCISPSVVVNKNVTVFTEGGVTVTYSTKADLDTAIDLVQDIKPKTDLNLK